MSDSVRPHRQQPTRLHCPWYSPGKNTGVGCHFLLQCMKVKSEHKPAQSCPTRSDPRGCSLPGSSVHGIFQARILEWVAIAFSQWTWVWVNWELESWTQLSDWAELKQKIVVFQSLSRVWHFATPWRKLQQFKIDFYPII